jgi:hypothetical protein
MKVYVLIDSGEFVAVFDKLETAMNNYNKRMKEIYNIDIIWVEVYPGTWYVARECKVGTVSIKERLICTK